ncbi:DoxX family protein [Flavihumibacter fluvii]|uniref:DoxX family protein n=1 Tax=Flavihumibacter fluvii TaxID=2838157 RepID=UPI001BDE4095|nr:DoxX family protein [Flavihumibacter fluvii]ULQ52208.1 DoxX family protein [Flavihumibacter fluvii]
MSQHFFSPQRKIWFEPGIAMIRIITGLLMAYHGFEIFDGNKMLDYARWLTDLHFPNPALMAYLGKGAELISGVCITLGLFTRLAVWPMMLTMLGIAFGMGHGKIYYEDQHPFLFVLIGLFLFFNGPGKYSLDQYFYGNR